jgi:hypothetical protein
VSDSERYASPTRKIKGRPAKPQAKDVLRECPRHGATQFGLYGRAKPRYHCKKCLAEAVTRRHRKVRAILVDEAGGCCVLCGYDTCMLNLHFHHVDPSKKSFDLSMGSGKGLAARREEVKKCFLVCANCHGEIEAGLLPCPPAGSTYESLADFGGWRDVSSELDRPDWRKA